MWRDFSLTLAFCALCNAALATGTAPIASSLTGKTLIDGASVTVGDLFTNAGDNAGYALAPAPTRLKPLVLSKADLQRVADYFKLNWQAPEGPLTVTLLPTVDENSIMVPVLNVPLAPNSVISEEDLTETPVARNALRATMVLKKEDLLGQVTKRTLMAGQALQQTDVMPPLMVKRNEIITVSYKSGVIALSTKARALDNAAKGDVVNLMNPLSKKPFQAIVVGPQQAEAIVESNS